MPVEITLFEDIAFVKSIGGQYRGSDLTDSNRVIVRFDLSRSQLERLEQFRHGQGGDVDANAFAEAMNWAKSTIFSTRRAAGL